MRIEVKGRNLQVTEELRELVARRFEKVGKQVSELAVLEVELSAERNPSNPDGQVAEATLHLKGVTLRAESSSRDIKHSINLIADELAPPGQAPPRQAPQAPRVARRRRPGAAADRRHGPSSTAAARGLKRVQTTVAGRPRSGRPEARAAVDQPLGLKS